jgi:hypothetical protein
MLRWNEAEHMELCDKVKGIFGKGQRFKGYYPATQLIATKQ